MEDPRGHRYDLLDTLMQTQSQTHQPAPNSPRPPRTPTSQPAQSPDRSRSPARHQDEPDPEKPKHRERSKRLRFKSPSRSHRRKRAHPRDPDQDLDLDLSSSSHSHSHSHSHRKHRRRKHHTPSHTPSNPETENADADADADADQEAQAAAAFRASLFDALADDEALDFWSQVYSEPLPSSIPYKSRSSSHFNSTSHPHSNAQNEQGPLERMTDEEYTTYMRQRMYEKTHQYLFQEKAEREERRKKAEQKDREARRSAEEFGRAMDESLRRGRQRKDIKGWETYLASWSRFAGQDGGGAEKGGSPPWPVRSGRVEDVGRASVKEFFEVGARNDKEQRSLRQILKIERVRWHPDKVQQRLGEERMSEKVKESVTAVFQVVDEMFSKC